MLDISKFEIMVAEIFSMLGMNRPMEAELFDLRRQVGIGINDVKFSSKQMMHVGVILVDHQKKYFEETNSIVKGQNLKKQINNLNNGINNEDRVDIFDTNSNNNSNQFFNSVGNNNNNQTFE